MCPKCGSENTVIVSSCQDDYSSVSRSRCIACSHTWDSVQYESAELSILGFAEALAQCLVNPEPMEIWIDKNTKVTDNEFTVALHIGKILAVKMIRARTGLSLRRCKNALEATLLGASYRSLDKAT